MANIDDFIETQLASAGQKYRDYPPSSFDERFNAAPAQFDERFGSWDQMYSPTYGDVTVPRQSGPTEEERRQMLDRIIEENMQQLIRKRVSPEYIVPGEPVWPYSDRVRI